KRASGWTGFHGSLAKPAAESPSVIRQSLGGTHAAEVRRAICPFRPLGRHNVVLTGDSHAAHFFSQVTRGSCCRWRVGRHGDGRAPVGDTFVAHGLVSELQVVFEAAVGP